MSGVQDQPYQLERRTLVLLAAGMVVLVAAGIAAPALFGGSPCADLVAVADDGAQDLPRHAPGDRPPTGIRAFAAGDQMLLASVVAATSTQVDALLRLDGEGVPIGECLDLALISELPAFLLAADGEGTVLLRADGEERIADLRGPAGTLRWETALDVPAGAPGGIAIETTARLTPDTVVLDLPADAEPPRVTLERATGEVVSAPGDG